jgi:hypothetical protein
MSERAMTQAPFRILLTVILSFGAAACGGSQFEAKPASVKAARRADGTVDDRSMCDHRNKPDREASEVAGPGSIQPNVRRVYQLVGTGEDRHKALICREIDTNFDNVKDVVRHYNDKGESIAEEADANYDGRLDTWITFVKGRLAEVKLDTNADGNPDEWKYYTAGKLSRVTRDTNRDGKPDVWEIYRDGKLERMGVDADGDEHVDRWDHDNELRRRFEDAERKKDEEAAAAAAKKVEASKAAAEKENEAAGGDAAASKAAGDKGSAKAPAKESAKRPNKK